MNGTQTRSIGHWATDAYPELMVRVLGVDRAGLFRSRGLWWYPTRPNATYSAPSVREDACGYVVLQLLACTPERQHQLCECTRAHIAPLQLCSFRSKHMLPVRPDVVTNISAATEQSMKYMQSHMCVKFSLFFSNRLFHTDKHMHPKQYIWPTSKDVRTSIEVVAWPTVAGGCP
jgi:hypothetical protein